MNDFNSYPTVPPEAADEPPKLYTRRGFLGLGVATAAAAVLSGCTELSPSLPIPENDGDATLPGSTGEFDHSREQDVLAGNWDFMPGAKQEDDGLRISHTGLAVLTSGGTGRVPESPEYQPNPPINLWGEHIEMGQNGNVSFMARLSDISGAATISLHSAPPIRRDESIIRQPGVDVIVENDQATIRVWDEAGASSDTRLALPRVAAEAKVIVTQVDEGLQVTINGQTQQFTNQVLAKQAWFGFDATEDWKLDQLAAAPVQGNTVTMVDASTLSDSFQPSPEGLASIAAANGHPDKLIGTAVDLAELVANSAYTECIIKNFNQIQTETMAKLQAWQPEEGKLEFAELDALVAFANKHSLEVIGHCLTFTEALPQWAITKLQDADADKDAVLQQVITPIVERYNGKNGHGLIRMWDVINEPFDPEDWSQLNRQNIYYQALGPDYMAKALRLVKDVHPEAITCINDWAIETDEDRRTAMLSLALDLKEHGLDCVGLQCHVDEEALGDDDAMEQLPTVLANTFDFLRGAGLSVRISEASVALSQGEEMQSRVYATMMTTAMRAPNCLGVNFWGATNSQFRNAYFTGDGHKNGDPGNDAPTVQDANGEIIERPAMSGMRLAIAAA